jgi:hypothetical protein
MKNITDIYEEGGCCSTPGNTVGMGNPMPAGVNGENGTEPLSPTAKAKKQKKKLHEGILSDVDTTINTNDNIIKFAAWYMEGMKAEYPVIKGNTERDVYDGMLSCCECDNKGNFTIDYSKTKQKLGVLVIPKSGIPSWLKSISVNGVDNIMIMSYIGDLSNLNFKINTGRSSGSLLGRLEFSFKKSTAGNSVKFGRLVCDKFEVTSRFVEDIIVNENSIIGIFDLSSCKSLRNIYGRLSGLGCYRYVFPKDYVVNYLKSSGLASWSADIEILGK